MGGSVATGLLNMSPHLLSKKTQKKPDKETKFKSRNTSKINAYMLQNFAVSTSRVTKNSKMVIRRRHRCRLERY